LACTAINFLQHSLRRYGTKNKKGDPAVGRIALFLHRYESRAASSYLLAVVSEPFFEDFFEPFLLFFLVVLSLLLLGVWAWLPAVAGGVVWAANIMGIATANTSPKIVFFMVFSPSRALPATFP